ncbi:M23 family metallopeptidase [Microbacterium pseudoresistens]|uniref:Murein DD-endopeptidase MepM/ murein hydrolase activator NlpD n=1 Tax=Microbacterium pseudoresistens TaxID=640634 RepID=A0A7Y9ET50_9MICO|nr:murein DD-endopeptidase MepM/ murein hydrolase activator NlpD [Microbacterium pseudoresistens]
MREPAPTRRSLREAAARQQAESQASAPVPSTAAPSTVASRADAATRAVPRRSVRPALRKVVTVGASAGVMGLAGLLAVTMTLPSQAVAAAQGAHAATSITAPKDAKTSGSGDEEIQAFIAPTELTDVSLQGAQGFAAVSRADLAAEAGIRYSDSLYTNDTSASIQWPYVVGVAMSSPFGMRDGVMHEGIDLIPGLGAPIQAIADGTVRLATESDGGYGVGAYIDHVIDGRVVTSHYAHMQYGSLRMKTGDVVKVGDIVGLTGDTGHSFGAHLHFELIVNGAKIDPLPWMLEHAGRK